jgi:hypothetical protein
MIRTFESGSHACGSDRRNALRLSRPQGLAGIAAQSAAERVAAQMALADLSLATFLNEAVVPYEDDEIPRDYGGSQKGTRNFSADHAGVASGPRSHLSRSNCFARWSQARATSHAALRPVTVSAGGKQVKASNRRAMNGSPHTLQYLCLAIGTRCLCKRCRRYYCCR